MIIKNKSLRLLVVGAGRRIQNNFLPALSCLKDDIEIYGIHSRTFAKCQQVAKNWNIKAIKNIKNDDISKIDTVAISVPTAQNYNVLKQFEKYADKLNIVIDTPIAWTQDEFDAISPLLKKFKKVVVTEDYMNFPQFTLLRNVISTGIIGELKSITLNNIGFYYHGLALIRSFIKFEPVVNSSVFDLNDHLSVVKYDFINGLTASVIGPYRQHTAGGIFVEGSKGIITEFPTDAIFASRGKAVYQLKKRYTNNDIVSGFEISGGNFSQVLETPDIQKMYNMNVADKSALNLERGWGLIEVLKSLYDFRTINSQYSFQNAFYDSFVSRRAEAKATPLDRLSLLSMKKELIAKGNTFIKKRPLLSADLPNNEKYSVQKGSNIEVIIKNKRENHQYVDVISINGSKHTLDSWCIYLPDWHIA